LFHQYSPFIVGFLLTSSIYRGFPPSSIFPPCQSVAGAGARVDCPAGAVHQQGHHAEVQLPRADAGGTKRSLAGDPAKASAGSAAGTLSE